MVLFVVFIFFYIIVRKKILDVVSKFFIDTFVLIWSLSIILSQTGALKLAIPQDSTLMIVSLHLFSFVIGFLSVKINWGKNVRYGVEKMITIDNQIRIGVDKVISNKLFLAIFLISFVYVIHLGAKFYATLILLQTMKDVRSSFYEGELYGPAFTLLNPYILYPLSTFLLFLFGYMTIFKRNWLWSLIGVYLFVYYSLGGGRLDYVRMLISIIFCAFCLRAFIRHTGKNVLQKYQYHIITGVTFIVLYVLIVLITAARYGDVGANQQVFADNRSEGNEQIYLYFVGPIVAFDYSVEKDLVSNIGGYKMGALTFASVEEVLYVIANKVGVPWRRPINDYGNLFQEETIEIGDGVSWNALYTWCNYFYCDMGIIGILLLPAIIGFFFRHAIKYFYYHTNIYSASLILLLFISLSFSIIQYPMGSSAFLICVLMLLFFSNKVDSRCRIVKIE